jgi:hypothetical protein
VGLSSTRSNDTVVTSNDHHHDIYRPLGPTVTLYALILKRELHWSISLKLHFHHRHLLSLQTQYLFRLVQVLHLGGLSQCPIQPFAVSPQIHLNFR